MDEAAPPEGGTMMPTAAEAEAREYLLKRHPEWSAGQDPEGKWVIRDGAGILLARNADIYVAGELAEARPGVTTPDDRLRDELLARNPLWDVWYVPGACRPTTWHCMPKALPHHEDSAGELGKWLDEQRRSRLGKWLAGQQP